ncbi:hypothetical protein DRE_07589 [Drechslerella stenobrocha 248]|uniref:Fe2OG dioxygenase domain-containing protein n=1 Tax=Drechslerella stenobrocha 248 TaxID=1043628 RepID=W7HU28_9PEZI|nr:hypothetical protein DRE_07589 [Drechslerella stenobrocha 248]
MANADADNFHPLEAYRITSLPQAAYYIPAFLTPAESDVLLADIARQPWTTLTHRRLQPHPAPLTPSGHLLTTKQLPPFLAGVAQRLLELSFADGDGNDGDKNINSNDNINVDAAVMGVSLPLTGGSKPQRRQGIFSSSPHGRPNHVLINEYPPGTGIAPHEDGGAYFPVVCTVSLGAHIVLDVTPKRNYTSTETDTATTTATNGGSEQASNGGKEKDKDEGAYKIFQEPLSLLITMGEMYTNHLHGIAATTTDGGLSQTTVANWPLLHEDTRKHIEAAGGVLQRENVRVSLTCRDVLKVKDAGRLFGSRR